LFPPVVVRVDGVLFAVGIGGRERRRDGPWEGRDVSREGKDMQERDCMHGRREVGC